jgi:Cu-Zn family superoxide dismutase
VRGWAAKTLGMRRLPALTLCLTASLALVACGGDEAQPPSANPGLPEPAVSADLRGPGDESFGTVTVSFADDAVLDVRASGLPPGPHGFHLHTTGRCEPDSPDPTDATKSGDFLSAGGHLAEEGQTHGSHSGDLPSLIVGSDGTAQLRTTLSDLTMDAVLDEDGTAVMVHAEPDNFANIPDRYAPQGPDEATTKTGDAGGRIACAVLSNER